MNFRLGKIFLAGVFLLAAAPFMAQASGLTGIDPAKDRYARSLSFYNTHTQERLDVTYWQKGRYDREKLKQVNTFLRDHRNGKVRQISPDLLNLLHDLKRELKRRHPEKDITFHVISGYRSAQTNAMLRANGGGQAKKSRHVEGDAMDIRVPGISSADIRDIAWCLQRGGVGYYRGSDFVHVDTSRVRFWNWAPKANMCKNNGPGA